MGYPESWCPDKAGQIHLKKSAVCDSLVFVFVSFLLLLSWVTGHVKNVSYIFSLGDMLKFSYWLLSAKQLATAAK